MVILSLPVEFWGHVYPHGKFEINYKNPKTRFWTYTGKSAVCGDRPYVEWIHETFGPTFKANMEGFKYACLVKDVVLKDGVPDRIRFDIEESDDNQNWRIVDLDNEIWQKKDAKIKMRGEYF